ncbi:MAG: Rho termination factor N-terminal domain-containing protein [Pseudomonadota bacterium]
MAKKHGNSIKDNDTYEALRQDGASKEKAARIANAQANKSMNPPQAGGEARPYEERAKDELYEQAQELNIEGRSGMSKDELIDALRNH